MTALKLPEILAREHELLIEDVKHRARNGLLSFTLYTFPDFEINWHHQQFCRALNRFANGEIKRLIVTMPPRHTKSEMVSRRLPAYLLGRNPDARIIAASYSADLASAMNRDVQRIIDSPSYQELFPETRLGRSTGKSGEGTWSRNSTFFEIVGRRGVYRSAGVGGSLTGHGGNYIIADDVLKNQKEADSAVFREALWDWWRSTLYTRLEKDASVLITMTRWHELDLVGKLLELAKDDPTADQWEVISFPAIAEGAGSVGLVEDHREVGEPLWPAKYSATRLAGLKASVGSRTWAALYQQRPAPEEGMIIKREWWRFYQKPPESFELQIQAWDLRFSENAQAGDFVVGVLLGRHGANIYLLDMVRGRLGFTESLQALRNLSRKWPAAEAKYVERAANGFALVETLRTEIPGIIAVAPLGSKVARANAVAPRIEAGNVWLPDPKIAPWVNDVIEEWAAFPAGAHDDIVDAMSHGLAKIGNLVTDWLPISLGNQTAFPV